MTRYYSVRSFIFSLIFVSLFLNKALVSQEIASDYIQLPSPIKDVCNVSMDTCYQLKQTSNGLTSSGNFFSSVKIKTGDDQTKEALLPHRLGPLHSLVTEAGTLILFEEFYRSRESQYAVMVLNTDLKILKSWSLENLKNISRASSYEIDYLATAGRWLADLPQHGPQKETVVIPIGKTALLLSFRSGQWELKRIENHN